MPSSIPQPNGKKVVLGVVYHRTDVLHKKSYLLARCIPQFPDRPSFEGDHHYILLPKHQYTRYELLGLLQCALLPERYLPTLHEGRYSCHPPTITIDLPAAKSLV